MTKFTAPASVSPQFQYKIVRTGSGIDAVSETALNDLGMDGWQLVASIGNEIVFMRQASLQK